MTCQPGAGRRVVRGADDGQRPFRFHDADAGIRSRKTVITLDGRGDVSCICFTAHLADIVDLAPDQRMVFYRACRSFLALTRDPAHAVSLKLGGGEMVDFDNRRVLHAAPHLRSQDRLSGPAPCAAATSIAANGTAAAVCWPTSSAKRPRAGTGASSGPAAVKPVHAEIRATGE